jgi:hypothetical protein
VIPENAAAGRWLGQVECILFLFTRKGSDGILSTRVLEHLQGFAARAGFVP